LYIKVSDISRKLELLDSKDTIWEMGGAPNFYGSSLGSNPEKRVLKKLSLAGLAKLSRFGLASADYRGLQ
jgi:hypothetical protein